MNPIDYQWLSIALYKRIPGVELCWETMNYGLSFGLTAKLGNIRWGRVLEGETSLSDPETGERWGYWYNLNADDHFDDSIENVRNRVVQQYLTRLLPEINCAN